MGLFFASLATLKIYNVKASLKLNGSNWLLFLRGKKGDIIEASYGLFLFRATDEPNCLNWLDNDKAFLYSSEERMDLFFYNQAWYHNQAWLPDRQDCQEISDRSLAELKECKESYDLNFDGIYSEDVFEGTNQTRPVIPVFN